LPAAWSVAPDSTGILLMIERKLSAQHRSPPQDSRRASEQSPPFEDTPFSDVWADAQRSRTDFVRASVQALVRQIRRALAQADAGIASQSDRKAETPNVS
jgi:hypothetical protein